MPVPPSQPGPAAVLVVSSRLDDRRQVALAALVGPGRDLHVAAAGQALPLPASYAAVLLDAAIGRLDQAWLACLLDHVVRGASLVVIADGPAATWPQGLARVAAAAGSPAPRAEWFAKLVSPASPLTRRLGPPGGRAGEAVPEVPVVDRLCPLVLGPAGEVLVSVSLGFTDRPAVVAGPLGQGRVVVSGLGNTEEALADPDLASLLRRSLAPAPTDQERRRQDRTVGLAVVGYGPYGGMGAYHGTAAQLTDGLEMVAACDSSPERRKAAEDDFPGVRAYSSVEELAADDDVEVVVVATPPVAHVEVALSLLRAGKHVACEKPLCFTLVQADHLTAAARQQDRVLTVHQNRRWDPDFLAIRRAVDAGLLGDLFNVETFVGGFEHPCRAWHSHISVSGGAVYDWGSHHLDWALLLLGDMPVSVTAHGHKRVWHDVTNLDQVRVHLTWPDGREAEFVQSDVAGVRRPKFWVQGTAGTLAGWYRPLLLERVEPVRGHVVERFHHAEAPAELTLARYESGCGTTETRLAPAPARPFAFHRNLADHLLGGEELAVTPESARRLVAVLEAAQRSCDQGARAVTPGSVEGC